MLRSVRVAAHFGRHVFLNNSYCRLMGALFAQALAQDRAKHHASIKSGVSHERERGKHTYHLVSEPYGVIIPSMRKDGSGRGNPFRSVWQPCSLKEAYKR